MKNREITNPFYEGQAVVCISDNFPHIKEHGGMDNNPPKPKVDEELIVDEILGDFLRFDKYDTDESYNWWHHTRFALSNHLPDVGKLITAELLNSQTSTDGK